VLTCSAGVATGRVEQVAGDIVADLDDAVSVDAHVMLVQVDNPAISRAKPLGQAQPDNPPSATSCEILQPAPHDLRFCSSPVSSYAAIACFHTRRASTTRNACRRS
jgi:hypothetical protein